MWMKRKPWRARLQSGSRNCATAQDELIAARTQMQQLRVNAPQASQIDFLRSQIGSLESEIADQTAMLTGGSRSFSSAAIRFQELQLENELAAGQLELALGSLLEAKTEARRKLAYVERISDPSMPDDHAEPRRIRGILATLLLGLIAWGVLSTLIVGIREHRD
jgi:capsular polysaccharide transport system permease protein